VDVAGVGPPSLARGAECERDEDTGRRRVEARCPPESIQLRHSSGLAGYQPRFFDHRRPEEEWRLD
jgi:hypothetical protein